MNPPRIRAGDADRTAAADRLARHFTQGRLTADEYDERIQRVYAATYLDDLPELFADLPPEPAARPTAWPAGPNVGPAGPGTVRYRRHPSRLLPVVLIALLIIGLTHGLVLIPVLWIGMVLVITRAHRARPSGNPRR